MGSVEQIVIPGMRICATEEQYVSGVGTYSLHGYIYSSLAGKLKLVPRTIESDEKTKSGSKDETITSANKLQDIISIEVHAPGQDQTIVPAVGDIVTCKVVSVNPRFAKLLIECVNETPLKDSFRCQLRKEDVRSHDKDRVEMYKSFRPADVVLARVLSLGEASSGYLVTTAENELGVVIAKSEMSGIKMIPVSWTEMQCPKTYNKEYRKIAKVIPEDLNESL